MGLFSSVGKAISKVAGTVSNVVGGVTGGLTGGGSSLVNSALSLAGSLLGTGASLGGSYLSYSGQQQANQLNIEEAERNREWQTAMSNTAHQRQVADLKAAGLNPILSAYQGGAAVGSGAQAHVENPYSQLPGAISSARNILEVQTKQLKLQEALNQAQIGRENSQTALNDSTDKLALENIKTAKTQQTLNSAASLKAMEEVNTTQAQAASLMAQAANQYSLAKYNNAMTASVNALTHGDPRRLFGKGIDYILNQNPKDGPAIKDSKGWLDLVRERANKKEYHNKRGD